MTTNSSESLIIEPRVLIICENASFRFGGESSIPLHYFKNLRNQNIEVWLIVNERVKDELTEILENQLERVSFVSDTWLHKILNYIGLQLPETIRVFLFRQLMILWSQYLLRSKAQKLILQHNINVIHQPIPVSPKYLFWNYNFEIPMVIGPLNGGMTYPPAFAKRNNLFSRFFLNIGRQVSDLFHQFIPGKLVAAKILVANQRTYDALPSKITGKVEFLCENGIDTDVWKVAPITYVLKKNVRVIFVGRLVQWKGVDLLIEACKIALTQVDLELEIIGEGKYRKNLELLASSLQISEKVKFVGWLSQSECAQRMSQSDIFVLPSLFECGGAVILEAMSMKLPVIATKWGGPLDYLDDDCGILIEPNSPDTFVNQLAQSIIKLSKSPELRQIIGEKGHQKVINEFDWQKKAKRMIEIYQSTILQSQRS